MKKLLIIIDNGHGIETKGKCSPDKRLLEWRWTREFANMLYRKLHELGIACHLLVPEEKDVSLGNRCLRANTIAKKFKDYGFDCIFLSIHVNAAASDGQWHDARGCTAWVYTNGSSKSKALGQIYGNIAKTMNLTGNRWIPAVGYFTANYYVLKNTDMPAVLIENCFQDNKDDVDYLLSEKGKNDLLNWHTKSILQYMETYEYK